MLRRIALIALLSVSLINHITNAIPIKTNNDVIKLPLIKRSSLSLNKRASSSRFRLYDQEQTEYLIKVNIGTPPQEFLVSIDTGSADMWVPSPSCPDNECPYSKFNSDASSTFHNPDKTFAIQYGAGSIDGDYGQDTIYLENNTHLAIKQQMFGLARSAKDGILSLATQSNGILGLGFPALTSASETYQPFVYALAEQHLISQPVFSIALQQESMMIGGVDQDFYQGDIHYVPVTKNSNIKTMEPDYTYWSVGLKALTVNDTNVFANQAPRDVILDTGTTLSYLDQATAERIVKLVTQKEHASYDLESEVYVVDCSLKNSDIILDIAFTAQEQQDVHLMVHVQDLVFPLYDDEKSNECGFGITYNFDKENTYVFGGTILRSAYFVFDVDQKRVGLATAIQSASKVTK